MAFLTFKEITELMDRVADRGIGLLEIESSGLRLRIEGRPLVLAEPVRADGEMPVPAQSRLAAASAAEATVPREPESEDEVDGSWHVVSSPIVGTYYEAPNPEADPFVRVGDRVTKGSVLCIIEAMKLMNEIETDVDGEIMRIFPKNGQPIEYGERLFALKVS